MKEVHSLLKRQIRRYFGDDHIFVNEFKQLLNAINEAYNGFDLDREMAERSLELNSQELLDANAQMRAIFLAIPDLVFRLDYNGIILGYQGGKASDFFKEPEMLIGKAIFDGPFKEVNEKFLEVIERVKQNVDVERIEYFVHSTDNKIIYYEARILPLLEGQLIVIIRNITEDKDAQHALKDSEQKMKLLLENSLDGILLTIPDGKILTVNAAAKAMFGYSEDELKEIGESNINIIDVTESRYTKAIDERKRTGKFKGELSGIRKNGTKFPIEIATSLFNDYTGNPLSSMNIRDITEKKNAENKLKRSEEKYRNLIDNMNDGIFIADGKGIIQFANNALARIHGYDGPDKLLNKDFLEFVEPSARKNIMETFQHEIQIGDSIDEIEMPVVNAEGSIVYILVKPSIVRDGQQIIGVSGIVRNITEKKNAENKLKRSEEKYRNLIDNINDGIFIIDGKGIFQFANNALGRIYGFDSPDKLLNKDFIEFVEPSARKEIMESFQNFIQLHERINEIEMPVVNTEGSIVYILAKPSIVRDGQQIIGVSGIVRNITENKKTEHMLSKEREELRTTLSIIADGVVVVSVDDIILKVNKVFVQLTGLGEDQLIGLPLVELFRLQEVHEISNVGENISENIISKLKNMNYDSVQKFKITVKNGSHKIVTINLSPIKNEKNNIEGYIFVFRDLTDIINMEKQLSLSQKLESIGELAAGIAHEINTPLQYVGDNMRFMQDSFAIIRAYFKDIGNRENGNNNEILQSIHYQKSFIEEFNFILDEIPKAIEQSAEGVERMSKIVLAMKDFAHPGICKKTMSDINHAIEVTMNISRNKWKYVADIETNFQENLALVNCMMDEINQVFLNIIVNAAHAIEEKLGKNSGDKGKIKITTSSDDTHVFISINDTGKGISPKNIERIFDPFFTTKDVGKGTGQGLAISHDIVVKKHNGRIKVESEIEIGTTFTIVLPIEGKNENE